MVDYPKIDDVFCLLDEFYKDFDYTMLSFNLVPQPCYKETIIMPLVYKTYTMRHQ